MHNILKIIFDFTNYIRKNPLQALTYFLLFNHIYSTLAKSSRDSSDSLTLKPASHIDYSELQNRVDHAIETSNYPDIELWLENYTKEYPEDILAMEEKLRLNVYRQILSENSLWGLNIFKNLANQILKLDPNNELALSVLFLLNIKHQDITKRTFVHPGLPEQNELRFPLAYFARAFFNIHKAEELNNIALVNDALEDLNKAFIREKSNAKNLFLSLRNEAKRVYYSFVMNENYQDLDFFSLNSEYSFLVNAKSASFFNHHHDNHFELVDIRKAIADHFPLILRSKTLNTSQGTLSITNDEYKTFVLLSKNDHFYLYEASINSEYKMKLKRGFNQKEITLYKSELSNDFLEENVSAVISPSGYIVTTKKSLDRFFEARQSVKKELASQGHMKNQHFPKTKNRVIETYEGGITYRNFLLIVLAICVIFIRTIFNNILKLHTSYINNANKRKIEEQFSETLLNTMNETHFVLTSSKPIWTRLKSYGENFIICNTDTFEDNLKPSFNTSSLYKKYPDITSISFSKPNLQELWLKKLSTVFGKHNTIKDGKSIGIKIDYPALQNEVYIKNKIIKLISELLDEQIQNSPEFRLSRLINNCRKLHEEIKKIDSGLKQFWLANKDEVLQYKFNAASYLSQMPNLANKANEMKNVTESIEKSFLNEDNNNISQKDIHTALLAFVAEYKNTLDNLQERCNALNKEPQKDLIQADAAIQILKAEIQKLKPKINVLMPKVLELTNKLSRLRDLNASLQISAQKFKISHDKNNNNVISFKSIKPTKKEQTKNSNKETEEERSLRLEKFRQQKKSLKEEKLKKQIQDRENLLRKEENELKSKEENQNANEIKLLKLDPLLDTVEHQIQMLSESNLLFETNKKHDLIKFFSGNKALSDELLEGRYKDIVYYILLMAMIKGFHSLGQMMIKYEKYFLLDIKPYIVRNTLMHKFWMINVDHLKILIDASSEFQEKFHGIISKLRTVGFPKDPQEIVLASEFFSDNFLASKKKIGLRPLLKEMDYHFQMMCFMDKLVSYICSKNEEVFLKHFGLLHQSIVSCVSLIGALLDDLNKLDPNLYEEIKKIILKFESLVIEEDNANKILYQNIRIKVGHFFTINDTHEKKVRFFKNQGQDIYKELSPQILPHICHDTAELYTALSPIFEAHQGIENKMHAEFKFQKFN